MPRQTEDGTRFASVLARIGAHELAVLVALFLALGGLWVFAELVDEVLEGETQTIDERLLLAFRTADDPTDPLGPVWAEETARDVTALGSFAILGFVTLAAAGFLLMQRKRGLALYVFVAVGGGTLLSTLLKLGFDRPRPDLVPHGNIVYTSSLPSGHAMLSAIVYLTLGALLARSQSRLGLKAFLLGLALFLTVCVGLSRVYLGVHWPTDVLAGWAAGAVWALFCWIVAEWLYRRGRLEDGG